MCRPSRVKISTDNAAESSGSTCITTSDFPAEITRTGSDAVALTVAGSSSTGISLITGASKLTTDSKPPILLGPGVILNREAAAICNPSSIPIRTPLAASSKIRTVNLSPSRGVPAILNSIPGIPNVTSLFVACPASAIQESLAKL